MRPCHRCKIQLCKELGHHSGQDKNVLPCKGWVQLLQQGSRFLLGKARLWTSRCQTSHRRLRTIPEQTRMHCSCKRSLLNSFRLEQLAQDAHSIGQRGNLSIGFLTPSLGWGCMCLEDRANSLPMKILPDNRNLQGKFRLRWIQWNQRRHSSALPNKANSRWTPEHEYLTHNMYHWGTNCCVDYWY